MQTESAPVASDSGNNKSSIVKRFWWVLPFAYLWYRLIDNLRFQWETDPQYSYGLIVPLLVLGLLFQRWHRFSKMPLADGEPKHSKLLLLIVVGLAFFYLPTRLIEEATPEWRPISWLLAIEAIGLTLYAVYLALGKDGLKRYAFPICFFFVAVPWPTLFEQPIIQGLGRANAAGVVNVLSFLGVPTIQHGNIIETSKGMVGINDACSGIRSLQSSLMISLFLGELYFMNWTRRLLLIPAGFLLAMFFNLCRTSFLTYIASQEGADAIAIYHDEAGMTILFACTATLWAVSYLASRFGKKTPAAAPVKEAPAPVKTTRKHSRLLTTIPVALVIWIVLVEVGVELWYDIREAQIKPGPKWSLVLPEKNPTFKQTPFTPEENELLRFDDGTQGHWLAADGTYWQAFYFDWRPGRVAGYLAKRHTPDVCLTGEGLKMISGPTLTIMNIKGIHLPMRHYVFTGSTGPLQVYQCHWEPGEVAEATADESSRFNLIRGVWAGRGNKGQKVIEVVISGYASADAAKQALERELNEMIQIKKSS